MIALILAAVVAQTPSTEVVNQSSTDVTSLSISRVIRMSPAPNARVVKINGDDYLNVGGGLLLPMDSGRCTYSTGYGGKFYADQDFVQGVGIGVPMKGARPCDTITINATAPRRD